MREPEQYAVLDLIRGLASLLVLVFHLRHFLFGEHEPNRHHPVMQLFYFLTALGHPAVIVFFVLSGFVISRSVLHELRRDCFTFPRYLIKRASRLLIVLIPALCLTQLLDVFGMHGSDLGFYRSEFGPVFLPAAFPITGVSNFHGITFVGNLLFLQTIFVPTFGSNGPLWSLANEFWYYILFPVLVIGITCPGLRSRLSCGLAAVLIIAMLPATILLYGAVWILGAAVHAIHERRPARLVLKSPARAVLVCCGALFAILVAERHIFQVGFIPDFLLAVAVAALIYCSLGVTGLSRSFVATSSRISGLSYPLYLTHMPVIGAIWTLVYHCRRMQFHHAGLAAFMLIGAAAVGIGFTFHWVFEKRTAWIQGRLLTVLTHSELLPQHGRPR